VHHTDQALGVGCRIWNLAVWARVQGPQMLQMSYDDPIGTTKSGAPRRHVLTTRPVECRPALPSRSKPWRMTPQRRAGVYGLGS